MKKVISKKLKDKDKADGNTDILYRIEYWSSTPIFVYGVGKTIEEAIINVGILDGKGKPKHVKGYYIINNWPHLKSVDPIIRSYISPYNRPVFITSNFDCYYDEYLDECLVVSKTTGHSITLKNK